MKFALFSYKLEILVACWLASLQEWTSAYTIETMSAACTSSYGSRKQIRLAPSGPTSAASLLFDVARRGVEPKSCGVDVHVPNTHVIALHLVHEAPVVEGVERTVDVVYRSPCPLAVYTFTKSRRAPRRHLRTVDMCDAEAVIQFSAMFPRHHVTLVWMPPSGNFSNRLQASEVVVTAVGNGHSVCNTSPRHLQFPCVRHTWYSSHCVAGELVCDGRRNCPGSGGDEDPHLCASLGFGGHSLLPVTTRRNVTKLVTPTILHVVTPADVNNLVNISAVPGGSGLSFTASLSQYGPWGFVMLGLLVCGTVLMLCGLWECCCRSAKMGNATPVPQGTVPFVITSVDHPGQGSSAPPSYDDLDQPPAYSSLFP